MVGISMPGTLPHRRDTMTLYTPVDRAKLEDYLARHELAKGVGDKESACTVAAINLTLTGKLTAKVPDCMSLVLGRAVIGLQDAMPREMRNSPRYKALALDMPGTGRDREIERLEILMDWLFGTVLPESQPMADERGFGDEWRVMCSERTEAAAYAAAKGADAAAKGGYTANYAAKYAADAVASVADYSDHAAALAAAAADCAARAADPDFWPRVDPIGVLERMTFLDKCLTPASTGETP
jgi:hypothetical protein